MKYKNKKVVILGLGSYPQGSGISALRYLYRQGAEIFVTDTKTKAQLAPQLKRLASLKNIKYLLGTHHGLNLKGVDLIVKNPGVRADSPILLEAKKRGILVETDITLFLRATDNPIVAITGTRGKSTTSTLIYKLLQKKFPSVQLGGNIKVSPLNFLKHLKPKTPVVLELSSWQLNALPIIKRSPQVAVVTNIMVDHLNMYPSFRAYVSDKKLIYKYQKPEDFLIVNKDNSHTYFMGQEGKGEVYYFSLKSLTARENGAFFNKNGELIFQEGGSKKKILTIRDVKLLGQHNLYNILSAVIVAKIYGMKDQTIKKTVSAFKGIDSRLELIRDYKQVKFYNDTTATTPDATIAAINAFEKPPILIMGGTDKELVFNELAQLINKKIERLVLLPGTATEKLKKLISKKQKYTEVKSMPEAVKLAWRLAKPGDIILLSPGAASFGLFKNEFDRGEQYVKEVKKMK